MELTWNDASRLETGLQMALKAVIKKTEDLEGAIDRLQMAFEMSAGPFEGVLAMNQQFQTEIGLLEA